MLDAIAAVVNGQPLMRSDVEDAAWFARLSARLADPSAAAPATGLTAADKQTALSHLEDEQLLSQAESDEGTEPPSPERLQSEVTAQWVHLARLAGGEPALLTLLPSYHLDRATVATLIARQLTLTAYLDQHFGGLPEPDAAAIQNYYDTVFVPEAKSHGLTPAPLDQVRATIARILRQQQRATAEQQWLVQLRTAAQIDTRPLW